MDIKMYSVAELSSILNLHSKTIIRFIHEGKIKAGKIGRNWMVSEEELKRYCHAELKNGVDADEQTDYSGIHERITVSAVVEINEQNSEEASRISNSLMAMLNSREASGINTRFDFFYYPEIRTAKYVFYGSPGSIGRIMTSFERLCAPEGDRND